MLDSEELDNLLLNQLLLTMCFWFYLVALQFDRNRSQVSENGGLLQAIEVRPYSKLVARCWPFPMLLAQQRRYLDIGEDDR